MLFLLIGATVEVLVILILGAGMILMGVRWAFVPPPPSLVGGMWSGPFFGIFAAAVGLIIMALTLPALIGLL